MKKGKFIIMGLGWVVFGALIFTLMGLAVMYLWNWLIPDLFGGSAITFIQAIGLILLAKLLTGFGGWGGRYGGWKKGHHYNNYWKQRWEAKLSSMTPEEKEKFKSMYYHRCGWSREVSTEEKANTGN
jgi:ABC-type multidrug transport system fused ATPase/permease subunit